MKAVRGKQGGHGRRHDGFNERYFDLPKSSDPGRGIKNNDSMNEALAVMPEKRALRNSDLFFDSLGAIADDAGNMIALDVTTQPFKGSHFATFPPKLIEPLILAGCPAGGTVLDPFGGAGTTGLVADRLGRHAILIELNPEYAAMATSRVRQDAGLFAEVSVQQAI
jgi:DNA modification methylase